MTEREKDIIIAKAMGLNVQPYVYFWDGKNLEWHLATEEDPKDPHWTVMEYIVSDGNLKPLTDFGSKEGSWSALDYVRENPRSKFAEEFGLELFPANLTPDYALSRLTPSLIKQAAYQAAKELIA